MGMEKGRETMKLESVYEEIAEIEAELSEISKRLTSLKRRLDIHFKKGQYEL